jgi:hypothetical protein
MVNSDILEIANQASLKILADAQTVDIKHKFRLNDKSIWGVLFFLFGGIFISVLPFAKNSDTASKVLGVVIGLFLVVLSILTLIRQASDRLTISNTFIKIQHNLKRTTIPINRNMKIKMKTEIIRIRRVGTLGSDFIIVSHYLHDANDEIPVLRFQMNKSNSDKAIKLGNEITQAINKKFQQFS